jgi:hypothetical protein
MKKFFLNQFQIQKITPLNDGKLHLLCCGDHEQEQFIFNLYLSRTEFEALLAYLKETGSRIKTWLNKAFFADLVYLFRKAVLVDSCWITIKVIEFHSSEQSDKEFCVENFGFIPEEF